MSSGTAGNVAKCRWPRAKKLQGACRLDGASNTASTFRHTRELLLDVTDVILLIKPTTKTAVNAKTNDFIETRINLGGISIIFFYCLVVSEQWNVFEAGDRGWRRSEHVRSVT